MQQVELRTSTIYIPHWLDSMDCAKNSNPSRKNIYIPHWLDSMSACGFFAVKLNCIYIPHWLDSMAIVAPSKLITYGFTFHTG